jgi:hypothetical protein
MLSRAVSGGRARHSITAASPCIERKLRRDFLSRIAILQQCYSGNALLTKHLVRNRVHWCTVLVMAGGQ